VAPAVAENSVVSIDSDNNSWKYGFSYQGNAVAITASATALPIVAQALNRNAGEPGSVTLATKLRIQTAVHTDTQTNNQLKFELLARVVSRAEYVAGTAPTTNTVIFSSVQKVREDVGGTSQFIVDVGSHTIPIPARAATDSMILYSLTISPVNSTTLPVMVALSDTYFGIECSAINSYKLIDLTNASVAYYDGEGNLHDEPEVVFRDVFGKYTASHVSDSGSVAYPVSLADAFVTPYQSFYEALQLALQVLIITKKRDNDILLWRQKILSMTGVAGS